MGSIAALATAANHEGPLGGEPCLALLFRGINRAGGGIGLCSCDLSSCRAACVQGRHLQGPMPPGLCTKVLLTIAVKAGSCRRAESSCNCCSLAAASMAFKLSEAGSCLSASAADVGAISSSWAWRSRVRVREDESICVGPGIFCT